MASNFEIAIEKKSDGFVLKLEGDFDATSAYELIYAIKKLSDKTVRISIYTSGVKNIYPYAWIFFTETWAPLIADPPKLSSQAITPPSYPCAIPACYLSSHFG